MNVTIENLAPCKKLMRVEVDASKVNETFEAVTKDFQRHAALPGFRPGKVPKEMLVKRFQMEIEKEVKTQLTRDSYQAAVREQKLSVVGYPDIEEIQFAKDQPYQFAATIETAPDFELPEYKGLPAKREKATVTEADVDRAITMLRERQIKYETAARELKEGDVAVVNYQGYCDGKPISELAPTARGLTNQKAFWVDVHKGSFIPGFAEQLIGAKAGDKRTVNVDFAADFVTPQLQNKKGTFDVEVVEVKEKVLPELNDALAKSYGAEDLQKLREGVRKDLENELKFKQERSVRDQVVNALLEQVKCDLPEAAVLQETRNVVYNIVTENQRRGVPAETLQKEKEQIYASANLTAKERVKASFLFGKIAEKENFKIEQAEVVQRINQLAKSYDMSVEKFVKELQKRDGISEIYDQLLTEKVVEFLVANAKIEEVEPAPPKA